MQLKQTLLRLKNRALKSLIVNNLACRNETKSNDSLKYGTLSKEMQLKTGADSETHPSKEKLGLLQIEWVKIT